MQALQGRLKSEPDHAGAIQYGNLAWVETVLEQFGNCSGDLPCFDPPSPVSADDDLARIGDDWLIVLVAAGPVVGDQSLGHSDNLRCRAVIAPEDGNLRARLFLRKVQNIPHVRCPERVQDLVIVAYYPQARARFHEMVYQTNLPRVDVLIFVYEHMVICASQRRRRGRIVVHCANQQRHHVGEVDGAGAAKGLFVDPEEFRGVAKNLVAIIYLCGEALGVEQAFLGARDDVQDVDLLVPPHPPRAEDLTLLRRIPELKSVGKPSQLRIASDVAKAESMKGCNRQTC